MDHCLFYSQVEKRREYTYIHSEIGTAFIEGSNRASKKERCVRYLEEENKESRRLSAARGILMVLVTDL